MYNHNLPVEANPSCLQTTLASVLSQKSSHTVPHALLLQISTRPLEFVAPVPRRRMSPFVHVDRSRGKKGIILQRQCGIVHYTSSLFWAKTLWHLYMILHRCMVVGFKVQPDNLFLAWFKYSACTVGIYESYMFFFSGAGPTYEYFLTTSISISLVPRSHPLMRKKVCVLLRSHMLNVTAQ